MLSPGDLATNLWPGEATAHFETAVWFYSSGENDDNRMAEALSRCADRIVLLPGPAPKLPGGVRKSFSVSSALDYCRITNAT